MIPYFLMYNDPGGDWHPGWGIVDPNKNLDDLGKDKISTAVLSNTLDRFCSHFLSHKAHLKTHGKPKAFCRKAPPPLPDRLPSDT